MNTKNPLKTRKGFPIMIPLGDYYSRPCLFKIIFGSKYFIWKGKALLQSCELLAVQIANHIASKSLPARDSQIFFVVQHILRTRCLSGQVEVILIDEPPLDLLKAEQMELDKADENCLNNNEQAYVPVNNHFVKESDKEKFLKWYESRKK